MAVVPESREVARERIQRREFDKMDEKYGPRYYNMDGKPISMWDWAMGIELRQDRHVGDTYMRIRGHGYRVSTVLLGLDHSFRPGGPPIIFETMVFMDGDMGGLDVTERYCTKAQAKAGHRRICRLVRKYARDQPTTKRLIHNGRKP